MRLPQEIIRLKRDGGRLSDEDITAFVGGIAKGTVADAQIGAFAMAVFFRGMAMEERVALTRAMARSGTVLDWSGEKLTGPVLDKHSTGGVGDGVSIVLGPMLAALGAHVPMISGRGLGHTGGTLDKFEAIPGYTVAPDLALFRKVTREVGCAIIGQTSDLAPADKRVYAVRDVTATVESIPLITASILSKKLAAGLQGLVMDVKTGNGAFMPTLELSHELAASIASVATGAGLPTVALVTDMDEPLGMTAGNAVEMRRAIEVMTGRGQDPRFLEVTLALAAEMAVLGRLADNAAAGRALAERALADGRVAERFAKMVAALGGPADILERPDAYLAKAPIIRAVPPSAPGRVAHIDTRAIGMAVVALGGGRTAPTDKIDPAVGLVDLAPIGAEVGPDRPLCLVHARDDAGAERAMAAVRAAYRIGAPPAPRPLVMDRIGA